MDRCSVLRGSLNGRRIWGRMNTDICMAESLCCLPEIYITLLVGYTPIKIKLKKKKSESCSVVSDSLRPHGLYSPWESPGQNTGKSSLSLLQRIFPTQGLNWDLLHCRQILYQLSYEGSPSLTECPTIILRASEILF